MVSKLSFALLLKICFWHFRSIFQQKNGGQLFRRKNDQIGRGPRGSLVKDHLNSFHNTIKFEVVENESFNFESRSIHFLDLTIWIDQQGYIQTNLFQKPCRLVSYLLPSSSHPQFITKNIPYSLAYRLVRIESTQEGLSRNLDILLEELVSRGYRRASVQEAIDRARQGHAKLSTKFRELGCWARNAQQTCQQNTVTPVGCHFRQKGHDVGHHLQMLPIETGHTDSFLLRAREAYYIANSRRRNSLMCLRLNTG